MRVRVGGKKYVHLFLRNYGVAAVVRRTYWCRSYYIHTLLCLNHIGNMYYNSWDTAALRENKILYYFGDRRFIRLRRRNSNFGRVLSKLANALRPTKTRFPNTVTHADTNRCSWLFSVRHHLLFDFVLLLLFYPVQLGLRVRFFFLRPPLLYSHDNIIMRLPTGCANTRCMEEIYI